MELKEYLLPLLLLFGMFWHGKLSSIATNHSRRTGKSMQCKMQCNLFKVFAKKKTMLQKRYKNKNNVVIGMIAYHDNRYPPLNNKLSKWNAEETRRDLTFKFTENKLCFVPIANSHSSSRICYQFGLDWIEWTRRIEL